MSEGGRPAHDVARSAVWVRERERGSLRWLRVMVILSLALGRLATRPILHGIAVYFLLFGRRAGPASRAYLARVLGHPPTLAERYRHVLFFATTIHDRVFLLNDRDRAFDIHVHGREHLDMIVAKGRGALLFGAHFGSFEVLRSLARQRDDIQVCMAMFPENARRINAVLDTINAGATLEIIPLGSLDSMLQVRERLEAGYLVGILADRSLANEQGEPVEFLGATAPFPPGPFRMAALLRGPVYFMAALYGGGNRYDVYFEPLIDYAVVIGKGGAGVSAGVRQYAQTLARYCRLSPYNWFNFFDFWQGSP